MLRILGVVILFWSFSAKAETVDIVLRTHFLVGKAHLTTQSQGVLDQLHQVLEDFPTAQVLITGHSDQVGSEYRNKFLSQQRARAISDYLIKKGISGERIISRGMGSKEPIADNLTESGRALNRRVDVQFSNLTSSMAAALRETISVLPEMARFKSSSPESRVARNHNNRLHYSSGRTQASLNTENSSANQNSASPATPSSLAEAVQVALPAKSGAATAAASSVSQLEDDPLEKVVSDSAQTNTATVEESKLLSPPLIFTDTGLEKKYETQSAKKPRRTQVVEEPRPFKKAGDFIRYNLGVGGYFNSLDVTNQTGGGTANWVSKINYNAELALQWSLTSSKSVWMGIKVAAHKQGYEHNQSPSLYSWDGESPDLFRAALSFDFEGSRLGVGFDFDVNEEAFLHENAFLVTIEKSKVFGVTTRLKYKILNDESHSTRIGFDVSYAVGGVEDAVNDIIKETKAKDRLSYVGYFDFRTREVFKENELGIKLYYGLRSFADEYNLQEEEIVGLIFSIYSPAWL